MNLFKFTYFCFSLFGGMVAMPAALKHFAGQGWVLFRAFSWWKDLESSKSNRAEVSFSFCYFFSVI